MKKEQERAVRIKVKKITIRGDEVAILFFSLVFLAFLFISFFRLFAIGKFFDDFIFLFLFGWSKYLVYLFLFIIILPICFNYYFRFKPSFMVAIILGLFSVSWLVSNVNLLINSTKDIWWQFKAYSFDDFSNYFDQWWDRTIINNYHGFFASPISFESWNNLETFFPSFAVGGVVTNFLIVATSYGTFTTNFVLNLLVLLFALNWLVFSKPWLFFIIFIIIFKPIIAIFKKKKIERISEKSLQDKTLLDAQVDDRIVKEVIPSVPKVITKVEPQELKQQSKAKSKNKEIIIRRFIQESGNLTPFGKVDKDQTVEITLNEEEIKEID